jgi:molybdopterin molybdotransferase
MARYKLKAKPFHRAVEEMIDAFEDRSTAIYVPSDSALGYILAEDIYSPIDLPPYNVAFYDGYAVKSRDISSASASSPVELKVTGNIYKAGEEKGLYLERGQAIYVSANSPLPEGADTVVRMEYVEEKNGYILVKKAMDAGEDIVHKGEDLQKGDLILVRGQVIRPQDIALLLELNIHRVNVYRKPMVGILSVGTELKEKLSMGFPYPDNYSILLGESLKLMGAEVDILGVISDNPVEIREEVLEKTEVYDIIALIGGASIGLNDTTGHALEEIGEFIFHGTTLSPGKVSGVVKIRGKPVFLVPGHVGSAISCLYNFIYPLLMAKYLGGSSTLPKVYAELASDVPTKPRGYTFRTVSLKWIDDKIYAFPHEKRLGGSTLLTVLTRGRGFILIPPGVKPSRGDIVEVILFSHLESIGIK